MRLTDLQIPVYLYKTNKDPQAKQISKMPHSLYAVASRFHKQMNKVFDIAVIGGGISGFSSAMRLQDKGYSTLLLEAHGQVGGCAGFYSKKGFTFDVGATTLVDFGTNGVGGNFLKDLNINTPKNKILDYNFGSQIEL